MLPTSPDWFILSDTHYGLEEMDKPLARRATTNMLDLAEQTKPGHMVFNGDTFDFWRGKGDLWHRKSLAAAQRQFGPMRDFLEHFRGKILFLEGNCDAVLSQPDAHLLHQIMPSRDGGPVEVRQAYYDPEQKLLLTHGHRINALIAAFRRRQQSVLDTTREEDLPQEYRVRQNPVLNVLLGNPVVSPLRVNIMSGLSRLAKCMPAVQQRVHDVHHQLMNTLANTYEQFFGGKVSTAVFSHTHQPGIVTGEQRTIVNTGTAGPQDRASRATIAILRSGQDPEIHVTADRDSKSSYRLK